jgi:hypothetical protein
MNDKLMNFFNVLTTNTDGTIEFISSMEGMYITVACVLYFHFITSSVSLVLEIGFHCVVRLASNSQSLCFYFSCLVWETTISGAWYLFSYVWNHIDLGLNKEMRAFLKTGGMSMFQISLILPGYFLEWDSETKNREGGGWRNKWR